MMGAPRAVQQEDFTTQHIQPYHSEEQEFLDALFTSTYDNAYQNVSPAAEGTCQWIYNTEAYQQCHYLRQGILCIQGTPGSGKSTLLRSMVESQMHAAAFPGEDMLIAKHFFDSRGASEQNSFVGFIRSLLYQIFSQKPRVLRSICSFRRKPDGQFDLSLIHLREVLLEALSGLSAQQCSTYLFIDAVNECDEFATNPDACLEFLHTCIAEAQAESLPLHIYISIETTSRFPLRPRSGFDVRMEGHIAEDIEKYVHINMTESTNISSLSGLALAVSQMASSNFLAANIRSSFVSNELAEGSTAEYIEEELHRLPAMLDDLMAELLRRIKPRFKDKSLKIFQCSLASQRPLTPQELLIAIDEPEIDPDLQNFSPRLRSWTAGLLTTYQKSDWAWNRDSNAVVVFIHPIARKFLVSQHAKDILSLRAEQPSIIDIGHEKLLSTSLSVLRDFVPDYSRRRGFLREYRDITLKPRRDNNQKSSHRRTQFFKTNGFLLYAVEHIFAHAAAIPHLPSSKEAITELDQEYQEYQEAAENNQNQHFCLVDMWGHLQNYITSSDIYGPSTTILHILSRLKMADSLKELLSQGRDCSVATRSDQTPLHWAAFFGSKDSVEVLLIDSQKGETIEEDKATNTHNQGSEKKFLLFNKDDKGRTALHLASSQGYHEIVKLLISNFRKFQAKLRSQSHRKSRGLQSDFSAQQLAFVEDFINMQDLEGNTALHLAAANGQLFLVELLLHQGADWKALNNHGETAEALASSLESSTDSAELEESLKSIVILIQATASAAPNLAELPVPEAKQVDRMFEVTKVRITTTGGSSPIRTQLSIGGFVKGLVGFPTIESPQRGSRGFDWIHVPANNMRWIELVMLETFKQQKISDYKTARDHVLRRELWVDRQSHGSSRSGISFMRPVCHVIPSQTERRSSLPANGRGQLGDTFVLFIPYLHWETEERQSDLALFTLCKHLLDSEASKRQALAAQLLSEKFEAFKLSALKEPSARALLEVLESFLDTDDNNALVAALQRYLSAFPRDGNKRLIKTYGRDDHPLHIRRTLDQSSYHMLDSTSLRNNDQVLSRYGKRMGRKKPIVMMVDQLWLWVTKDAVISSFPRRKQRSRDDPDALDTTDVFESIYQKISTARSPAQLSNLIIKECTGLFFDSTRHLEEEFRFLEIFADSISKVADKEAKYHKIFLEKLNDEGNVDSADIRQEYELLHEMKDIREELQMMAKVLRKQQRILDQGTKFAHNDIVDLEPEDYEAIEQSLQKIDAMISHTDAICASINELIDLRQNYANLSEAQSARKQAEETAKQGNTIMVFTIVTILFLPASFMTSFFALPLLTFENSGSDKLGLSYVVKWIMVFTMPLAILLIYLAFYINPIIDFVYKWGAEHTGSLKTGLKEKNPRGQRSGSESVKPIKIEMKREGFVWSRPRTWFRNGSGKESSAA